MKAIIFPSRVSGRISAPPSKSYTHRAIILASLARGKSVIKNALISGDTERTLEACKLLGAKIRLAGKKLEIKGVNGRFPQKKSPVVINCGLSGTTLRLMTAVAVLSKTEVILTGEKRLLARPVGELVKTLKSLGIDIKAAKNNKFPPVKIKGGRFRGGKIAVSGNISSQFISALLLIAPFAQNRLTIIAENLKSAPYVDITVDLMKTFGVKVTKTANTFDIENGQEYLARECAVEGDYSSASYFFAAGAMARNKITVDNLNPESVQGDKCFLQILESFKKSTPQRRLNLGNFPDIVPTVAVVAATQNETTVIRNIGHLRTKETDRIAAVAKELRKMGIETAEGKDSLTIKGGKLKGAEIDTHNDHRMAMAFAIAGLSAEGKTIINNAEVVNKSYPAFWEDLEKLGAKLAITNPRRNIVLIGMAGSGKSTVSKLLAEKLERKLVETDRFVERKTGMPIAKFVEISGWKKFRDLESEAINRTNGTDNSVISTGGGAVTRDMNIAILKRKGILIWLKAGVDTLAKRLKEGEIRPLFGHSGIVKREIARMYAERKGLYKKAADFIIETDNKNSHEVMKEIIFVLKKGNLL